MMMVNPGYKPSTTLRLASTGRVLVRHRAANFPVDAPTAFVVEANNQHLQTGDQSHEKRRPLITSMDTLHVHAISMSLTLAGSAYIDVMEASSLASSGLSRLWEPLDPAVIAAIAASTAAGGISGALMANGHRRGVQKGTMVAMAFMAVVGAGMEAASARPFLPSCLDAGDLLSATGVAWLISAAAMMAPLFCSGRHRLLQGGSCSAMRNTNSVGGHHSVVDDATREGLRSSYISNYDPGSSSVASSSSTTSSVAVMNATGSQQTKQPGLDINHGIMAGLTYIGPSVVGAALAAITGLALLAPAEAKDQIFEAYGAQFDSFLLLTAVNGNLAVLLASFAATLRDRGAIGQTVERAMMAAPVLGFCAMVHFLGEMNPATHWLDGVIQLMYLGKPLK